MRSLLRLAGDRVLSILAPKASARADTSWTERCYCRGLYEYKRYCHTVGGATGCGACEIVAICV
jgi:7-cyano-7-deazaguanine synthase in queuosine biosynthesis